MRIIILLLLLVCHSLKAQLTTSNLPIFIFNTNGQSIVDEPKINTELKIIFDENGGLNSINDTTYHYNDQAGVEYSGAFSQHFDKKNLNIELRTNPPIYEENHVGLFGFPAESDWILVANYLDLSHSKNALSQYLYQNTGTWSPKTIHCEVIINGTYQGLYLLCEKIKRDGDRVDIKKLDELDLALPEISGGYLIVNQNNDEIDPLAGWASNASPDPKTFEVKYPKEPETVQLNFIKDYIEQLESMFSNSGYEMDSTGYRTLLDDQSIMNYIIIHELAKNSGAYHRDQYFFKERNEKLKSGPVWDFDFAYGRKFFDEVEPYTDFRMSTPTNSQLFWYSKLKEDCVFIDDLNTKYKAARDSYLTLPTIYTYIDSLELQLTDAANRDRSVWYPNETVSYGEKITEVKTWISNRLAWMDDNYYNIGGNAPTLTADSLTINKEKQVNLILEGCLNNSVTWVFKDSSTIETLTTSSTTLSHPLSINSSVTASCQTSALCPITSNKIEIEVIQPDIPDIVTSLEKSLTIFPNPADKYISFSHQFNEVKTAQIIDKQGRVLLTVKEPKNRTVPIGSLSTGLYYLQLKTKEGKFSLPFLKE